MYVIIKYKATKCDKKMEELMKEVVKYHNDMNKISFSGYTEKELNLFFSLIFLAKEKQERELTIPFSQLKDLASNDDRNRDRFIKNLININEKLIKMSHKIEIDNTIHIFSLFNTFSIDKTNDELRVQINKMFVYMINDLIGNFTKFDLLEFVELKSSYSKNLFKLLKQWETLKSREFTIQEFRSLLNIPESYRMSIIDLKVLTPIMKELPEYFPNLKFEKIKNGKRVVSIKFSWKSKKEFNSNVKELIFSNELIRAFENVSKNKYISPFITLENKHILSEQFKEDDLIRGLNFAKKEIKQEFKFLNYLINCIETHLKKPILKIKEKSLDPKIEVLPKEQTSIITEVTQEEFNKTYEMWLDGKKSTELLYKSFCIMQKSKLKIIEK